MRAFSRTLALVAGSLLITTAMTKPMLAMEDETQERPSTAPTIQSKNNIDVEAIYNQLKNRKFGYEKTYLVGLETRLGSNEDVLIVIQDNFGNLQTGNESRKSKSESYEIKNAIWVAPQSDGPEDNELNKINYRINRGFLLENLEEQKENDENILKPLAQRILKARETEHEQAQTLFNCEEDINTKSLLALDLMKSKDNIVQELSRLYQAVFHMEIIREHIKNEKQRIASLKEKGDLTQNTEQRSRDSIYYLEAVAHALYPYSRSRAVGGVLALEHCTSQDRRQALTGRRDNNKSFELTLELLQEYKPFMEAVQALLYDENSPQLKDAMEKRVLLSGKPQETLVEGKHEETATSWGSRLGALASYWGGNSTEKHTD